MSMTFHTNADWQALLRTIREHPDADLPRLVAADWLTEQGHEEYAEFIRLQCEIANRGMDMPLAEWSSCLEREAELMRGSHRWRMPDVVNLIPPWAKPEHYTGDSCVIWMRGFVAEVRAPLAWLIGGGCETCERSRFRHLVGSPMDACPTCHGTGRIPGHLDELVKCQPVTKVVVTDREPMEDGGEWMWASSTDTATWRFDVHRESLTWDVAKHIQGGRHHPETPRIVAQWWYESRESALDALSLALLNPARERAGLPPLNPAATWRPVRHEHD